MQMKWLDIDIVDGAIVYLENVKEYANYRWFLVSSGVVKEHEFNIEWSGSPMRIRYDSRSPWLIKDCPKMLHTHVFNDLVSLKGLLKSGVKVKCKKWVFIKSIARLLYHSVVLYYVCRILYLLMTR